MPIGALLNAVTSPLTGGGGGLPGVGSLLSAVGGVASAVPIAGPAIAGVVGGIESAVGAATDPLGLVSALTGAVVPGAGANGVVDTSGFSGGNGRFGTRTTVETMDLQTGQIVRTRSMAGQPFMMKKDVAIMRRVIKQTGALNKRIPRKTRAQSKTEQLKDASLDQAIANIRSGQPVCLPPPKC